MAEDVARAVGASGPEPFRIAGKEVKPRPLAVRELTEVERDCVRRFRRQYLEAYRDNLDLLSPESRDRIMLDKIEETARWDTSNLPPKRAVDWQKVRVTEKLRQWIDSYLESVGENDLPTSDSALQRFYKKIAASLVDQGVLSDKEYKELTGFDSPTTLVPYVSWWITGALDGRIAFVAACCAPSGITREEIENDSTILRNPAKLLEIVQEIERLTAPDMGNG